MSQLATAAGGEGEAEETNGLQQWVYEQGYNYTVAENWVTQLSPEEREALCGYQQVEVARGPLSENLGLVSDVPAMESGQFGAPPSTYDAMALGYVTPIKNQSTWCGSCWIFAATADFESDVAIGETSLLNFAEQEVGDCHIYYSVGGYDWCQGGNANMTTNYFTKYGSADETCHPYVAAPGTCQGCTLLKNVDTWRIITGSNGESQITAIKNAILNYGPVYASMYASDPGFSAYDSGVYEYWGTESTDHAIEIIGWDDSKTHSGAIQGAWMIKNSWDTTWGAGGPYAGCAWVAYGSANLGDWTSALCGYESPPLELFYHDEGGWMNWSLGDEATGTAWGAVRFTPSHNESLMAVDFWAVDVNMSYEIKIFDTLTDQGGGNYTFSTQLGTTQTGSIGEQGYYSIPLSTPVPLTSGDDFIVQVKLTAGTAGWYYPLPIDYYDATSHPWLPTWSSIATFSGESYFSDGGATFTKPSPYDVGIRARAASTPPNAPDSPLCEGETNPTDVTDPTPEFGWTFSDPDGGDSQGAYQILVASSSANLTADNGDMWDSGKVSSSDGEVSYAGLALSESQTYYWKVKTWDNHDVEGDYCGEQQFTTVTLPQGLLRVETSPAVPTTILANGIPRNAWGLDWVKMPAGEYTLSFTDTPGYLAPEVIEVTYPGEDAITQPVTEPITVYADETTEVMVHCVQLGNLWVRTDPMVSTIISLDGAPPANNWGFWVDLLPGDYDLSLSDVVGYATPLEVEVTYPGQEAVSQSISAPITVEPGGTTEVVIHFIQLGNLQVETSPMLPATIFVDGEPMNEWGFWLYLEAGEYTVSFEDMPGYITPSPEVVIITAGVTTEVTGYYVSE